MKYSHLVGIICFALTGMIIGKGIFDPGMFAVLDFLLIDGETVNLFDPIGRIFTHALSYVFGAHIASKLFFVMVVFLSSFLGYLILQSLGRKHFGFTENPPISLVVLSAFFFVGNPFFYERMMVQPQIFFGITLLGYSVYFLFLELNWSLSGISAGLAMAFFPHASFMIGLIFLGALFFHGVKKNQGKIVLSFLIILLANINWIVGMLRGSTDVLNAGNYDDPANFLAFQSQGLSPLGPIGTNLLLYGFWGERFGRHFFRIDILSSLWYVAGVIILIVILFGAYTLWKAGAKKLVGVCLSIALISLILGVGNASSISASLMGLLYQYIPFFDGYREPQKWIGLLMIIEGVFFITGLLSLHKRSGNDKIVKICLFIATTLLVITWSPGSLFGFHNQLKVTNIPQDFTDMKQVIGSQKTKGRILALPWHAYIGCAWMGRPVLSHPLERFFQDFDVVGPDNIEVAHILYSNSIRPLNIDVENFLKSGDLALLKKHDFQYVLLMKQCASSEHIEALLADNIDIGELKKIEDMDFLLLYKIEYSKEIK